IEQLAARPTHPALAQAVGLLGVGTGRPGSRPRSAIADRRGARSRSTVRVGTDARSGAPVSTREYRTGSGVGTKKSSAGRSGRGGSSGQDAGGRCAGTTRLPVF